VVHAAIRDPGVGFGPSVPLGVGDGHQAVAVAPSGHAVVAWVRRGPRWLQIVAARRSPGGAFGAPESLGRWPQRGFGLVELEAGVDESGRATLLWARALPEQSTARIDVASAPVGERFAIQRLASRARSIASPVLAAAPDGWAILAHERHGNAPLAILERPPGGARFRAVTMRAPQGGAGATDPAVAIRDGGGAVVAWQSGCCGAEAGVEVATRAGPGRFSLRGRWGPSSDWDYFGMPDPPPRLRELADPFAAPPDDIDEARLGAALADDGRVLLAWTVVVGRRPLEASAARSVQGRLDGAFEPAQVLGAPLRDTSDVVPLFLADGRAAVTWTDNAVRPADGRLHVAVEGATAPIPEPAPRLTLHAPSEQRLFTGEPPRVTAVCGGPCDMRATIVGPWGPADTRAATNLEGGPQRLDLGRIQFLQRRPQWIRVVVHATARGGRATVVRSLRLRIFRRIAAPVRRPLDVRAQRRGDAIVVQWRTAGPARYQRFVVMGLAARNDYEVRQPGAAVLQAGRGRTRFSVQLHPEVPDRIRWVVVVVRGLDFGLSSAAPVPVADQG
jgi:hypothetical protein